MEKAAPGRTRPLLAKREAMSLHLIKLAVGVDDLSHMKKVRAARRQRHQQAPRFAALGLYPQYAAALEELLAGGSLY